MKPRKMPFEEIKKRFVVDPTSPTGIRYKAMTQYSEVLSPAGSVAMSYWQVAVNRNYYRVHRIVWALCNGCDIPDGMYIDHIDGNGRNNKITNLRLASKSQNAMNTRLQVNKKSGLPKGIRTMREGYQARVMAGKEVSRKNFNSLEEAISWLAVKRKEFHGDFSRTE